MYDKDSCEHSFKLFYHPIEAAIRWCGLQAHELKIITVYNKEPRSLNSVFPEWPCLHLNMEKLLDAIVNRDLPYGSLGITVVPGTQVPPEILTLRHSDLKEWMKHYYPDQKPSFLFDEMERSTHTAISIGAFHVLQAERDALQIQVNKLNALHQTLHEQFVAAVAERDSLLQRVDEESPLNERSQRGYECVLGAVLQVIFSRSPAGKRYSVFDSQDSLVSTIVAHSGELFGISKRSLDTKFAAARRRLKAP
ncbi:MULTISPECIES: hypothetical protein [unclassified Pseudomonas]|uniref:hypothetical protein n=1 Tax=unclassified Pseudomonas TaxID=196821 RepID=UPI000C86E02D|nr:MULTISPECIES: hypothetical protein [unclassified Pseudomonas]PMV29318.1 hypothetical protein C1X22_11275 [Pseudomonas sp. DP16D-L5]PMV45531.1 hypothetical protein C1X16_12920 [Pseudomonas sp. FW305-3-2-15-C-R2A1]PMV52026.1 hypothetical protein C1X18_12030 [Pseudomonas sp. FW305-3-2-15-C-LB1]PMV57173.1 hypothetical protein C1X19_11470 [Pseudomonas sp. GW460-4]PMV69735.1 hypothetical protein C1X13_12385 [Pseudomonas sp. GW123-5C08]